MGKMRVNNRQMGTAAVVFAAFLFTTTSAQTQPSIKRVALLNPVFEKLAKLDAGKGGKVNVVHIGDSHIQADYFTDAARCRLQQRFGDGGRGFVFPYSRNSPTARPYRFATNADWRICRNNQPSRCEPGTAFGLSGYGFGTKSEMFALSVEANEERYVFNTLKVVSPSAASYRLAAVDAGKDPIRYSARDSLVSHTVKSGETLDTIARNYNTFISAIKKENKLKSDNVSAGRVLRIPIMINESGLDSSMFRPVKYTMQGQYILSYRQDAPAAAMYVLSARKQSLYSINGLIVENDAPGVIYHNIGTVGAMAAHFNANYPLFFQQLQSMRPDLVVVSFGTNESYSELSADVFRGAMEELIDYIKMYCRGVPVLVTTPPMSLLRHKRWNPYLAEYSEAMSRKVDVAVWDLYAFTEGLIGVDGNFSALKINHDNIHYTVEGYENQGTAFAHALLDAYDAYKKRSGK
jgi:LysM repeat protein/lysophospholipase L1-like esterase